MKAETPPELIVCFTVLRGEKRARTEHCGIGEEKRRHENREERL
jgi:hypothetical protein